MIRIIEEGYADRSFRDLGDSRVIAYGLLGMIDWTHRWYKPGAGGLSAAAIDEIYAEPPLAGLETSGPHRT